jgi:hypothetical protein
MPSTETLTEHARTLSPLTSKLAPPEQRLLQTLLEQMLSPDDAQARVPRRAASPGPRPRLTRGSDEQWLGC